MGASRGNQEGSASSELNRAFGFVRMLPGRRCGSKPVGIAAQFNFTNAFDPRPLRLCTARAISSFPVPVSP